MVNNFQWMAINGNRSAFIKVLTKFAEGPYISSLVLFEREEMDFVYVNDRSHLQGETIHIKLSEEEKDKVLEMYSFSNAMAQSVKLAIWESSLNKFVSSIEDIIEDLRKGHKIGISRRQILMKIGELFSLRHLINLSSDLLDTKHLLLFSCTFPYDRKCLVLFACARYAEKYFASRSKQVKNSPETFLEPHFTSDTPSN
uniref:DUF155 domain-containing protein n=1 Tax=Biomphalaria glabrata TaxID=6526 RepID=A0A2C9LWJ4_BIOGL